MGSGWRKLALSSGDKVKTHGMRPSHTLRTTATSTTILLDARARRTGGASAKAARGTR